MNKLHIILALLFGISFSANAEDQYIRYASGFDELNGELQVAVSEYSRSISPIATQTVILYGVVHVADDQYYQLVQEDLDSYDVVLYEGVKQGTDPNTGTKGLNALQKLLGDVLGLTFQKDGIDYNRDHFVHADVSIDELRKTLKGQSIDPLERYISPEMMENLLPFIEMAGEFVKLYMQSNPELQNQLKAQMAKQLSETDVTGQMSPEMKKAILDDRNQIVQDILEQQMTTNAKSIAIFYGAAHMPDFEKRLEKLGFSKVSHRWMTAWEIGNGVE